MSGQNPPGWHWFEHSDVASFQHRFDTVATLSLRGVPNAGRRAVCTGLCTLLAVALEPEASGYELWEAEQESIGNEMALRDEAGLPIGGDAA